MASEDPKFWANLHTPRVDRRLSVLDVHQTDRHPPRKKSPDGLYRSERRGPAARARRALRTQFRKGDKHGRSHTDDVGKSLSFRQFAARQTTNQFTI